MWRKILDIWVEFNVAFPVMCFLVLMSQFSFFPADQKWRQAGLSLIFSGIVAVAYMFNRTTDVFEDDLNQLKTVEGGKKRIFKILILMIWACGYFCLAFFYNLGLLISFSVISFFIWFYCKGITIRGKTFRLKDKFILKNLVTAFLWALFAGATPMLYAKQIFMSGLVITLQIFIVSLVLSMTMDVRDAFGDKKAGVRTIALVIGVRDTKIIVQILCCVSLGISIYATGLFSIFTFATVAMAFWAVLVKESSSRLIFALGPHIWVFAYLIFFMII